MRRLVAVLLLFMFSVGALSVKPGSLGGLHVYITGDLLLARDTGVKTREAGTDYPYKKISPILRQADLVLGNLECPLTTGGRPVLKDARYIFKADPSNASSLKDAGFRILDLANNHSMDYSGEGLSSTLKVLDEAGISHFGAGPDRNADHSPVYIDKDGIRIGFLGFSVFPAEGYSYFPDKPDVAQVDENFIGSEIASAKAGCQVLVVSFHWGKEFSPHPSVNQERLARLSIDNGADLVVGHHPHVLQDMEKYKGKYIFYSLGNFVFDKDQPDGVNKSVILNVSVSSKGVTGIDFLPIEISACQPQLIDGRETKSILARLNPSESK